MKSNDPTYPPAESVDSPACGLGPDGGAPVDPGSARDAATGAGSDRAAPSADERLAETEAKLASVSDAYLRAKAEVENTRRRSEEELAKTRRFAVEAFAESLLPVCDSLEAAIAQPNATPQQMLEGVHATLRQLLTVLERNKVVAINPPIGTRFDPHQHQAMSMVPADQEPNTVAMVLQKGYLIAERVLRPALVTVAAPK